MFPSGLINARFCDKNNKPCVKSLKTKQRPKSGKVQLLEGLEVWRDLPMNLETSTMASRGSEKGKELKFEEMERSSPYVSKPLECAVNSCNLF